MTVRLPHVGRAATTGILTAALALAATVSSRSGEIIADARYEHLAAPGQFLARHRYLWDAERGAGEPARYFSPTISAFQALLAEFAVPPWLIERLTHTLYLTVAAVGACLVAKVLDPPRRWVPVAVGVAYAFNPYTTQYLTPSGLFLSYALSPWFAWLTIRALDAERQLRWAAGVALAVFTVGMLNTASLLFALIPAGVILVMRLTLSPRRPIGVAARFVAWTTLLTAGVSAAMLTVAAFSGAQLRLNLDTTENVASVARTSSAAESWRGLGLWLTYIDDVGRPFGTAMEQYFTNAAVVVASFVPPAIAAIGLTTMAGWQRRAFATIVGLCVLVMVGAHRIGDDGVLAGWFSDLLNGPALGLRTTYKAGAGLQLAVAVLAVWGLVRLSAPARPANGTRRVAATAASIIVSMSFAVAALPFYTGSVYPDDIAMREMPGYWDATFEWFDDQPHADRVLVLPGASRSRYRWGVINDSPFDARLPQPALMSTGLPSGTNEMVDLIWMLGAYAGHPNHESGAMSAMLRRLGVRWVILQNDLDWQAMSAVRPSSFDPLRADPGLTFVRGFGEPGENTTAPGDPVAGFLGELRIPPVEVYEVFNPSPTVTLETVPPVLLAGAGDSWPTLAERGLLEAPIQSIATISDESLDAVIDEGAVALVTDGARRRAARVTQTQVLRSHTLATDEPFDRVVQGISNDPNDQTVAEFGDLALVTADDYGSLPESWETAWRPAAATDGDPATAWKVPREIAFDVSWRADLREPTDIDTIDILTYSDNPNSLRINGLSVTTRSASGTETRSIAVPPTPRKGITVAISATAVETVSIRIDRVAGVGVDAIGLSEVTLQSPDGALDGRERLRVPLIGDDLRGRIDPAKVAYVFSRSRDGAAGVPEEQGLVRSFEVVDDTTLHVEARLRFGTDTPDASVDALLGGPVRAMANRRYLNLPSSTGLHTIDDNPSTAWIFDPDFGNRLEVELPAAPVDSIEIDVEIDTPAVQRSTLTAVDVYAFDDREVVGSARAELTEQPDCAGRVPCLATIRVPLFGAVSSRVLVLPIQADRVTTAGGFLAPTAITAVRVMDGSIDLTSRPFRSTGDDCRPVLSIDGESIEMRPQQEMATAFDVALGTTFESCEPIELAAGQHLLESVPEVNGALLDVMLAPEDWEIPRATPQALDTEIRAGGALDIVVPAGSGGIVRTNLTSHPGWRPGGTEVHATLSIDGGTSWYLGVDDRARLIEARFAPESLYRIAWAITGATLAVCLVAVLPRPRRRR